MTGPLKLTRVLAPTFVVGSLCAVAAGTTHPGTPTRVAPPCSPDGHCLPNYVTWGFYPTRWRSFPGDPAAAPPTEAGEAEGTTPAEELGGPQTPAMSEEGQVGPQLRSRDGAAVPAPTLPGDAALPSLDEGVEDAVPPTDFPAQPEGGLPATGTDASPEGDFAPGMIDPFSAAPPTPPEWMVQSASYATEQTDDGQAEAASLIESSPNMQGDDAPPALPAALQNLFSASVRRGGGAMSVAPAAVALAQPASVRRAAPVRADGQVMQASAESGIGIQLINPASAMTPQPGEGGLQQAIYFEASDLTGEEAGAAPAQ
jgi:hypothetical protein